MAAAPVDEYLEAAAWLDRLHADMAGKPNDDLFQYFRGLDKTTDLTVILVNNATAMLKKVFGDVSNSSYKVQSALYLYYRVQLHLLTKLYPMSNDAASTRRWKKLASAKPDVKVTDVLRNTDLHQSMLCCAAEVVCYATEQDPTLHFPWATLKVDRMTCMLGLWDAIRWFQWCFEGDMDHALPPSLAGYLADITARIEEQLALSHGSIVYEIIFAGGGSLYGPGDSTLLKEFTLAYAERAFGKVETAAKGLEVECQGKGPAHRLALLSAQLLDVLMTNRMDLCFCRHMAVNVACSIYIMAKLVKIPLSFKKVLEAQLAAFPGLPDSVFQQVEITKQGASAPVVADIRQYYNELFLPAMEEYARQVSSAAGTASSRPPAAVESSQPQRSTAVQRFADMNINTDRSAAPALSKDAGGSKLASADKENVVCSPKGRRADGYGMHIKKAAAQMRSPLSRMR